MRTYQGKLRYQTYSEKEPLAYKLMYGAIIVTLGGFIATVLLYKDIAAFAKGDTCQNAHVEVATASKLSVPATVSSQVQREPQVSPLATSSVTNVPVTVFQPALAQHNYEARLQEINRAADNEAAWISQGYTAQLNAQIQAQKQAQLEQRRLEEREYETLENGSTSNVY